MRVKPGAAVAFAVLVGYAVYLIIVLAFGGVDYNEIADSTSNLIRAVVIPIGLGSILLAVTAKRLGWWDAAMRERAPVGPRWLLVVPALMLLIAVLNLVDKGFGGSSLEFVLVTAIAVSFVGFSEELLTRGLLLVGFRGSMGEVGVWFFTSLCFGLLHGINIIVGQAGGATLSQMAFAFVFGSVLYLTRRVTGTLIICIALHAIWDFSVLIVSSGATTSTEVPIGLGQILVLPLVLIAAYGLVRVLRREDSAPAVAGAGG